MRNLIAGVGASILALTTLSFADGYQLRDFSKFLRGRDGDAKSVRYTQTYNYSYSLHRTGTGQYEIRDSYNTIVGTRQDINLNGLGELRKIQLNPSYITNYRPYEVADLHLTREQKAQFRQDPASYTAQLNQYLAQYGYRAEYKYVNQRDPRTGNYTQVPKLILKKY